MNGLSPAQVVQGSETAMPPISDLEPYHRLIALQKEIVKLAEQNERAKRHCAALLNQMDPKGPGRPVKPRTLRQKVSKALGQLPVFPAKSNMAAFVIKEEQVTC